MHLEFNDATDHYALSVLRERDGWILSRDGAALDIDVLRAADGEVDLLRDGRRIRAYVVADRLRRLVFIDGRVHTLNLPDEEQDAAADDTGVASPNLIAEMPGTVVKLLVAEGAEVVQGAPLMIVEAMKMETEITAPITGRVTAIHVSAGDVIKQAAPLIDLAPREADD